jgi:hypothetical protein
MRQDRMQWSYPRNLSALLLSVFMLATLPAEATDTGKLAELKLCPPGVLHTCFIGYVALANRILLLISSVDGDPLVGEEVEVAVTLPGIPVEDLDLSRQIGCSTRLGKTVSMGPGSCPLQSLSSPHST